MLPTNVTFSDSDTLKVDLLIPRNKAITLEGLWRSMTQKANRCGAKVPPLKSRRGTINIPWRRVGYKGRSVASKYALSFTNETFSLNFLGVELAGFQIRDGPRFLRHGEVKGDSDYALFVWGANGELREHSYGAAHGAAMQRAEILVDFLDSLLEILYILHGAFMMLRTVQDSVPPLIDYGMFAFFLHDKIKAKHLYEEVSFEDARVEADVPYPVIPSSHSANNFLQTIGRRVRLTKKRNRLGFNDFERGPTRMRVVMECQYWYKQLPDAFKRVAVELSRSRATLYLKNVEQGLRFSKKTYRIGYHIPTVSGTVAHRFTFLSGTTFLVVRSDCNNVFHWLTSTPPPRDFFPGDRLRFVKATLQEFDPIPIYKNDEADNEEGWFRSNKVTQCKIERC